MTNKPDSMAEDSLETILDDAFQMGVDHGAGRWNDYVTLKPGMLKKLNAYTTNKIIEARIDELKKSQRALQRPPKDIDTGRMNIDLIEWWFEDRLAELKALNHRKDK